MSLDLISAHHQKEIWASREIFSLNDSAHALLMKLAKPKEKFRILNKIDDYYADATLLFGELGRMRNELIQLMNEKRPKEPIFLELLRFIDIAVANGHNIYATAD